MAKLYRATCSKNGLISIVFIVCAVAASSAKAAEFKWTSGVLIPNEYGLENGTWRDMSINECRKRCEADKSCQGFSIEAVYGDDWQNACADDLCDVKTECHAKTQYGGNAYWHPEDPAIHVPGVDPLSNQWIKQWGTLEKAQ